MADQVEQVTAAMQASTLNPEGSEELRPPVISYAAATAASVAPKSTLTTTKKVLHLVIDSGAIIKGTNLGVLAEVRFKHAKCFKCTDNGDLSTK